MRKATIYIIFLVAIALYASCTPDDYVPPATGQTPQEENIDSIINDSIPISGGDNDTINDTIPLVEVNLLLNGGLEQWVDPQTADPYDIPEHWFRQKTTTLSLRGYIRQRWSRWRQAQRQE